MLQPHLLPRHLSVGRALASLLAGSWRDPIAPLSSIDPNLVELAIRGGAGALLARRVEARIMPALRDLYRHQVIEAARFERGLERRVAALQAEGIDPLVVKGWSIARLYPGKGLRHYSDLDLVVRPHEVERAEHVLSHFDDRVPVDLHPSIPHVDGRSNVEQRVQRVRLGAVDVKILGDEDHLWLLAMHALGHGAWRPVWLTDLAVLVESRALDWTLVFAGDRRDVPAVRAALVLAQRVLGMRVDGTPIETFTIPRWVEPALLETWGRGYRAYEPLTKLPSPRELVRELSRRWPDPIRATTNAHGPWNDWPRAPVQLMDSLKRLVRFARSRDREAGIWKR